MSPYVAVRLAIVVVLLLLSAFFSSAETALTAVNKIRLKAQADEGSKKAALVLKLTDDPKKLLSTILIGNNIVNLTASSMTTTLAMDLFGNTFIGIATGVLTLLVILFGEITPKTIATLQAEKLSYFYAPIINALMIVMTPLTFIVGILSKAIFAILGVDSESRDAAITEEELLTVLDVSHEEGVIETDEKEMINNVVDFGDSVAAQIMVPRINVTFACEDMLYEELMNLFKSEEYTRLPVYADTKDSVTGIINIKDLFFKYQGEEDFRVADYMYKPFFTFEQKSTKELLNEMRKARVSMAIVLDEYGATSGLVTMEDLVEEIVGEIRDEYDRDEQDDINVVSETEFDCVGSTKLDDVNELTGLSLESEDYETLAGHVISLLDHLPVEGETTEDEHAVYTILTMTKHRIDSVHISLKHEESEDSGITE